MKDFYDFKVLFEIFDFDKAILQSAVRRTFERRRTPMPSGSPTALTDEFASNAKKLAPMEGLLPEVAHRSDSVA